MAKTTTIKVTNTAVRGVNNVVFYVDTLSLQTEKNGPWIPQGYQVRVKHYNKNLPIQTYNHNPSNEELSKLWRWR